MKKIISLGFLCSILFVVLACGLQQKNFHNASGEKGGGDSTPFTPFQPPIPPVQILSKDMLIQSGSSSGNYVFPTHMLLVQTQEASAVYDHVVLRTLSSGGIGKAVRVSLSIGAGNNSFTFQSPKDKQMVRISAQGITQVATNTHSSELTVQALKMDSTGKVLEKGSATFLVSGTESQTFVANSNIQPSQLVSKNIILPFKDLLEKSSKLPICPNQIMLVADDVPHKYTKAVLAEVDALGKGKTMTVDVTVSSDNNSISFIDPSTKDHVSLTGNNIGTPIAVGQSSTSTVAISVQNQGSTIWENSSINARAKGSIDTGFTPRDYHAIVPLMLASKLVLINQPLSIMPSLYALLLTQTDPNASGYNMVTFYTKDLVYQIHLGLSYMIKMSADKNSFSFHDWSVAQKDPAMNNTITVKCDHIGDWISADIADPREINIKVEDYVGQIIKQGETQVSFQTLTSSMPLPVIPKNQTQIGQMNDQTYLVTSLRQDFWSVIHEMKSKGKIFPTDDPQSYSVYVSNTYHGLSKPLIVNGSPEFLESPFSFVFSSGLMDIRGKSQAVYSPLARYPIHIPNGQTKNLTTLKKHIYIQFDGYQLSSTSPKMSIAFDMETSNGNYIYYLPISKNDIYDNKISVTLKDLSDFYQNIEKNNPRSPPQYFSIISADHSMLNILYKPQS